MKPLKRMKPITLVGPSFINLEDLAKRFNQSEDSFLIKGLLGSLDLLVYVPASAHVGVTNFSGHIGTVGDMRYPSYLKIGQPEITDIINTDSALMSRSPMGYQLSLDGSLRSSTAHEGWELTEKNQANKLSPTGVSSFEDSGILMNQWTIKDIATNSPIKILRRDVLVQSSNFLKLKTDFNKFSDIDVHHYYSKKLEYLFEASNFFWNEISVNYSERENHPNPKKIIEWFEAQGFSNALAKAATTIITPEVATTRGPKPKTGSIQKLTKMSNSKADKLAP